MGYIGIIIGCFPRSYSIYSRMAVYILDVRVFVCCFIHSLVHVCTWLQLGILSVGVLIVRAVHF